MKHWAEETGSDAQKGSKHLALLTMIHASNKRALELCHFDVTKHVVLEGSEGALSFGESAIRNRNLL